MLWNNIKGNGIPLNLLAARPGQNPGGKKYNLFLGQKTVYMKSLIQKMHPKLVYRPRVLE